MSTSDLLVACRSIVWLCLFVWHLTSTSAAADIANESNEAVSVWVRDSSEKWYSFPIQPGGVRKVSEVQGLSYIVVKDCANNLYRVGWLNFNACEGKKLAVTAKTLQNTSEVLYLVLVPHTSAVTRNVFKSKDEQIIEQVVSEMPTATSETRSRSVVTNVRSLSVELLEDGKLVPLNEAFPKTDDFRLGEDLDLPSAPESPKPQAPAALPPQIIPLPPPA